MGDVLSKQYNNFANAYSQQLSTQDAVGNRKFYEVLSGVDLVGKEILDVGCGDGADLIKFKSFGAEVWGVDPSKEFVGMAKNQLAGECVMIGKAEKLPFESESFDIVVSKYSLQNVLDTSQAMAEIARVLRSGGDFVYLTKHPLRQFLEKLQTPNAGSDYFSQQIVDSFIYNKTLHLKEPTHTLSEYFSKEVLENFELVNFVEDYDFPSSEQINGCVYPTFFIAHFRRR